jgi:ATP-binding cassette subfamily F protein 3
MESLEAEIMKLEEEQGKLENSMIELVSSGDSKKIQDCSLRLGTVKKRVDDAFEELTDITTKHDDIFRRYEMKLKILES